MTDERLDELMAQAKHSYRVPAEPPLDSMWARIERETFEVVIGRFKGELTLLDGRQGGGAGAMDDEGGGYQSRPAAPRTAPARQGGGGGGGGWDSKRDLDDDIPF